MSETETEKTEKKKPRKSDQVERLKDLNMVIVTGIIKRHERRPRKPGWYFYIWQKGWTAELPLFVRDHGNPSFGMPLDGRPIDGLTIHAIAKLSVTRWYGLGLLCYTFQVFDDRGEVACDYRYGRHSELKISEPRDQFES